MKDAVKRINRTLLELWIGILLFGIIIQIGLLFFPDRRGCSIGLWIGIVTAAVSAFHIWRSLDLGLERSEKEASGYIGRQYVIRYVCIAVILVVTAITGIGNPLTAFVGLMGLKAGAYLQPVCKKISNLIYGKEDIKKPVEEQE